MDVVKTPLEGLLLIKPRVFSDARGYFFESYNAALFEGITGRKYTWMQDNESRSEAGVLRGLHFQVAPHAQAKLVRVILGAVLDVCVDIRPESATYGQHYSVELNGEEKSMLLIPEGFAHGFRTLRNGTVFSYKCSDYYHPPSERSILWNDPDLGIDWGITDPVLSAKDRAGMAFATKGWI